MTTDTQPLYHRNVSGGPAVKGVECRRCGQYVGLVQAKSGKWYTCQLVASMNPDSQARNAYPFLPHFKTCGDAQREADARRAEREAELRGAIASMEQLLTNYPEGDPARQLPTESIQVWQTCLVDEGYEETPR